MKKVTSILAIGFIGAIAAAGCGSSSSSGTGGTMGGSGGSSGTAVDIIPDATGWVDKGMNSLMVQGAWYAYGDGVENNMPPGKCQMAGHQTSECSSISKPDLTMPGFPQATPGKMCTAGMVAAVIDMVGKPGMKDYGNIFGNGIGLDLNAPGGVGGEKADWDAAGHGVKGISFEIDMKPTSGLRVEFPSKATDTDPMAPGGDYWGASPSYPNSPVAVGVNTILWDMAADKVTGPKGHVFDPHAIESIQFHVPTGSTAASYSFCISNLKMLM